MINLPAERGNTPAHYSFFSFKNIFSLIACFLTGKLPAYMGADFSAAELLIVLINCLSVLR